MRYYWGRGEINLYNIFLIKIKTLICMLQNDISITTENGLNVFTRNSKLWFL